MKRFIVVLFAILSLSSCNMLYNLDYPLVLTDNQLEILHELYGDTITFDNIYYGNVDKSKASGFYDAVTDQIFIGFNISSSTEFMCIIHEFYHKYQHNYLHLTMIDCEELEEPAYTIMYYPMFRDSLLDTTYEELANNEVVRFAIGSYGITKIYSSKTFANWLMYHSKWKPFK